MGRPHHLADPEYAERVADCFVAGMTREEICEAVGIKDPGTVTAWRKDPRVSNLVAQKLRDQTMKIVLKVDAEMMKRFREPENLTVKEMIEIRREYAGDKLRQQMEDVDENTINEAQKFFDENPDAAEQLRTLLTGGALPADKPG